MKDLKFIETINMQPSWESLLPLFYEWIDTGTQSQKDFVKDELKRLCKLADNLHHKNEEI